MAQAKELKNFAIVRAARQKLWSGDKGKLKIKLMDFLRLLLGNGKFLVSLADKLIISLFPPNCFLPLLQLSNSI